MKNERFEGCFQKYKNLIMRVVLDKTSDYQLAQEILQQVFCSFYVNIDHVREDCEKAWLMRCTSNAIIDYYRSRQRRGEIFADTTVTEAGNLLLDESMAYCEEQMDHRELSGRILREVKRVNLQWYEVLMLCCVEDLSCEEAAEKLKIAPSVLRARLYRARAYVRENFWDEYKDRI